MSFSKWSFRIAGIVGLMIVIPMIFDESRAFMDVPGPLSHPEYYYGFLSAVIAWQVMFFVISNDPRQYRVAMIPAMIEKFGYVAFIIWLAAAGRVGPTMMAAAGLDLVWGILFAVSFFLTRPNMIAGNPGDPATS